VCVHGGVSSADCPTIAKSAPAIQSVTFSNTGGGLTVTVTGYSTTRDMTSGTFTFAPATGSTLAQNTVTVPLSSAFTTWYQNSASNAFGSQFKLTVPFTVSSNAAGVASVSVTLTNSVWDFARGGPAVGREWTAGRCVEGGW